MPISTDKRPRREQDIRNTRRENRLEELGRVDAERARTPEGKRNLRDEKYRIRHELKKGGKVDWKKGKFGKKTIAAMKKHDFPAGGPHQSLESKKAALQHASTRAGHKKGGKVKNGPKPGTHDYMLQEIYSRKGKAVGGVIKAAKRAAKTVAAPGTHIRNVVSGKRFKDVTTKLIKGLPKIAKRGWK